MDTSIAEKQMDVKKAQLEAAKATLEHRQLRLAIGRPGSQNQSPRGRMGADRRDRGARGPDERAAGGGLVETPRNTRPPKSSTGRSRSRCELARGRSVDLSRQIVFVDPMIGPDGKYVVRAEVTNREENGQWLLRPGMKAQMTIQLK